MATSGRSGRSSILWGATGDPGSQSRANPDGARRLALIVFVSQEAHPGGRFEALFRFYGPDKPLFDRTWVLSDIKKVDRTPGAFRSTS
jgi:hypothetical protein